MELEHSFIIPVPPERAWPILLDVERMAPAMPGATVDSVDGDVVNGRIKVKVGPVSLTYAGSARFVERDEQGQSVTLEASGKETRGSGTASAIIRSSLRDEGGQTLVTVHTTLSVTGRPAQFGRGVMAEVGGKIIERFATNLAAQLAGGNPPEAGVATGNGAGPRAAAPGPAPVPIEELQLPARAYNSLKRVGIQTVDDLSARTEGELLAIENLGPQSVKEIKQRLADLGLALAAAPQDGQPATGAMADGSAPDGSRSPAAGPPAPPAARALWADGEAPRGARPPDEDAIDLLSVAGFPVLKRALPVAGAVVALLLVMLGRRRRGRRRAAG